jgi:antitoxin VapB
MTTEHIVHLVRHGTHQSLDIPTEFQIPTDEVRIRKEGQKLIIEPVKLPSLLALLATLPDIENEFPDVDEHLLPLDEIQL